MFGITPHAHYLGKDMKVTAILPDGTVEPLIWIKDWDFNWQGQYRYKEPVHLPQGTRIELEYVYDNSENNPHNPSHPPVPVTWGEETKNEMAVLFLGVELPSPCRCARLSGATCAPVHRIVPGRRQQHRRPAARHSQGELRNAETACSRRSIRTATASWTRVSGPR